MASIKLDTLKNNSKENKEYIFADIFLDIKREPFNTKLNSYNSEVINNRDIKIAYDLNAIKNSITNLFNTLPGERILLPDYGCDLRGYIFEPISEFNAKSIGLIIKKSIEKWEPRALIININIGVYIDELYYDIELNLGLPFLDDENIFKMSGVLNREGFSIKD